MLCVLPFHQKDQDQAERLAVWLKDLGGCKGHELLLGVDTGVTSQKNTITMWFEQSFDKVTVFPIKNPFTTWAEAPNHCFQEIARHIENNKLAPYWLWLEPDVVPLREGWLDALEAEYQQAKKPFMGAFVSIHTPEFDVPDHMSGVGIYPGQMLKYAGNALLASDEAWDCAAADQILPQAHKTKLIAHAWKHPTFENWEQVEREVLQPHPEAVLYHSSKDGSLIELLRARKNLSERGNESLPRRRNTVDADERKDNVDVILDVPTSDTQNSWARSGITTDILIKSYPKDYEWLSYCLRAIDKFATGFRRTVLVIPIQESASELISALDVHTNLRVIETIEAGDSYLYQQSVKASAHEFTDADYILHIDSDVILTQPITPESFFRDGKPVWYFTPYSAIDAPWQPFTEKFIGAPVEYEFMRRFPQVVPRKLHLAASGFCMAHHKMRLTDYILSQQNREFSEFNALGALAYSRAKEDFHWIDTTKAELPEPFGKQFWSYGGITPEIRVELEKILEELVYDNIVTNPRNVGGSSNQRSNDTTLHSAIRLANQMVPSGTKIRQTKEGIWVLTSDTHISKWVEEKGVLQHDYQTLPVVLPEIPVGGTVLDIGANIGDSSAPFLHRVGPKGFVIAIEPNPNAWECLHRNMEMYSNFVAYQVAASDKIEDLPFVEEENVGASHIDKRGVNIHCITIDSLGPLDACDFIKIDVEGYELRVLQGAERTITKFRPKMLIEINEEALRRQGTTQAEVLSWLSEHGYQWWPVNQPNLEQNAPQYDVLCKYIRKEGDEKCAHVEAALGISVPITTDVRRLESASNAAPKSNPESAAAAWDSGKDILIPPITPWRDKKESIAEIDRLACELKQFCTAPRSTLIVRERLRKIRVITKIR